MPARPDLLLFRGPAFDVLEEMGVLGEVRGHDTKRRGTTLLDETGTETGHLPAEAFARHGWETPRPLEAMSAADDFHFASACQIHLDTWSQGRITLIGDAGYCAAPTSGMGTSQALIGAHTLARELAGAVGDHLTAFAAYEAEMRPYVTAVPVRIDTVI